MEWRTVKVIVGGVDLTAHLANREQTAQIPIGGEIGRASLTFIDLGSLPTISPWSRVTIQVTDPAPEVKTIWSGFVARTQFEPLSESAGTNRFVTVDCQSSAVKLLTNQPIDRVYGGGDLESIIFDGDIATDLIQTYAPSMYNSAKIVSTGQVQVDYIGFEGESLRGALSKLAQRSGRQFKVDAVGEIWYGLEDLGATPYTYYLSDVEGDWAIDDQALPMAVKPSVDVDATGLRNSVRVVGGSTLSTPQTETWAGDSVAYIFQTTYPPDEIVSVSVANTPQTVGIMYVDDPSLFDCLVHYDTRKFFFDTPPPTGKELEIVYRYSVRIDEIVQDVVSVGAIGELWAPVLRDNSISAIDQAEALGLAYLASLAETTRATLTTRHAGADPTDDIWEPGRSVEVTASALGWTSHTVTINSVTARFVPGGGSCQTYWDLDVGSGGTTFGNVYGRQWRNDGVIAKTFAPDRSEAMARTFGSGYLSVSGADTGAVSQAQTFTNGIVGPTWKPASDGTAAIKVQNAAGTTNILTVDTTNKKTTLNTTSTPAALGAELVTNGAFATGASWTFGDGWAHDGAALTAKHTAGSVAVLSQNVSAVNGGTYLVTFDIKTRTAGTVYVSLGGLWGAIYYGASGSFAPLMTAGASGEITFTPSTDFDGSIDNVSVKRVTATGSVMDLALSGSTTASVRSSSKGLGIGDSSLAYLSSDSYGGNAAFGGWAMKSMVSGWRNLAFGDAALLQATTSQYATGIGYGALQNLEAGGNSVAIGAMALNSSKDSWNNVAIGAGALAQLDGRHPDGNSGSNVAIGANALAKQTVGYGNLAIGPYYEMGELTTGISNIGIGSGNASITTGGYNILIGTLAGYSVQTGYGNVLIGAYSCFGVTGGSGGNTAIGQFSGGRADGNDNLYLGNLAGYSTWSTAKQANRNTMVGAYTGYTAISSDSVFLGHRAGYYETGDGRLFVDNQSRTDEATSRVSSLIYGEFNATVASQLLRTNGVFQSMMTDSATNAATTQLKITHNTSGTVANGFGSRVLWELKSSTTADQNAAAIQALWNDATHATRKADLVLTAYDSGGEREGLRIRGNGSAAAIGFLGATPAAKRSHVPDASGGSTEDVEARKAISEILITLETFGLHATS